MKYLMVFQCWQKLQFKGDQINSLGDIEGNNVIQLLLGQVGAEVFCLQAYFLSY